MPDYTILTDDDFSSCIKYAPLSLKSALQPRWIYNLHIGQSDSSTINTENMQQRIKGGELLAYKFTECIIEGNRAVYCGFIPTMATGSKLTGTHKTCRFSLQEIFPRRLYVHLKRRPGRCVCSFDNFDDSAVTATNINTVADSSSSSAPPSSSSSSDNCSQWQVTMYDGTKRIFCCKIIDWTNIYVFMGESDSECKEFTKIPRDCPVCAQCYKCSVGASYCRTHTVCKHKKAQIFVGENSALSNVLVKPKIKRCKRIKL